MKREFHNVLGELQKHYERLHSNIEVMTSNLSLTLENVLGYPSDVLPCNDVSLHHLRNKDLFYLTHLEEQIGWLQR